MPIRIALLCACLAAVAAPLRAQTAAPAMTINPDRPDLTNSPRLLDPGIVQIEAGVIETRQDAEHQAFGSPVLVRIGVRRWFEAQVGGDGVLIETERAERATGVGNLRLGAKLRLLADSDGLGRFTVLPQVSLPAARGARQLGSGDPDYTLTFLTGVDIGPRARLDANYVIGAIGSGGGQPHFLQHVASASLGLAVTAKANAYFEGFGISRQEAGGRAMTAIDTGVIYTIGTRLAVDGGIEAGISGDAPVFAAFGGLSVALGHAHAAAHAHLYGAPRTPTSASAVQDRD